MSSSIIQMKDIRKSYYLSNGVEIPVLKGLDLELKAWEFVALMGHSGSGKSTLLNIIGFLHTMDHGSYAFAGSDVTAYHDDDSLSYIRNRKIGFIFQQYFLIPRLSARENVVLPTLYAEEDVTKRKEKAAYYLDKVGLADKIENKPSELSGGQQQRVAIARALVNEPSLILADEPTGALDSTTGNEIMELIKGLHAQGTSIVMVTHEANIAAYASRVIYLADGKILDDDYKIPADWR